jgi:hypothetical protein
MINVTGRKSRLSKNRSIATLQNVVIKNRTENTGFLEITTKPADKAAKVEKIQNMRKNEFIRNEVFSHV